MNAWEIHARELLGGLAAEAGSDCPTFNVFGQDWKILPGTAMYNQPLRSGGFSQMYDLSFAVLVSQFIGTAIPSVGILRSKLLAPALFTYMGVSYKVEAVNVMPNGAQIQIVANSADENA